jgi:hypothetical protein
MKKYLYVMSSLIFLSHISVSFGSDMPEKETEEKKDKGKERIYVQEGERDQRAITSRAFGNKNLSKNTQKAIEAAGLYAGISTTGRFGGDQNDTLIEEQIEKLRAEQQALQKQVELLAAKMKKAETKNTDDLEKFFELQQKIKAIKQEKKFQQNRLWALRIENTVNNRLKRTCYDCLDFLPMFDWLMNWSITIKELFPDYGTSGYSAEQMDQYWGWNYSYRGDQSVLSLISGSFKGRIIFKPEAFAEAIPSLATGREVIMAKFTDITQCLRGRSADEVPKFLSNVKKTYEQLKDEKNSLEYKIKRINQKQELFLEQLEQLKGQPSPSVQVSSPSLGFRFVTGLGRALWTLPGFRFVTGLGRALAIVWGGAHKESEHPKGEQLPSVQVSSSDLHLVTSFGRALGIMQGIDDQVYQVVLSNPVEAQKLLHAQYVQKMELLRTHYEEVKEKLSVMKKIRKVVKEIVDHIKKSGRIS